MQTCTKNLEHIGHLAEPPLSTGFLYAMRSLTAAIGLIPEAVCLFNLTSEMRGLWRATLAIECKHFAAAGRVFLLVLDTYVTLDKRERKPTNPTRSKKLVLYKCHSRTLETCNVHGTICILSCGIFSSGFWSFLRLPKLGVLTLGRNV